MTVRKVLVIVPTVLILFLVQSYFWVPTYEEQTRGNPERLEEFITGSIGDASILNPILSADSASSDIEQMVFEGLIDRDENLNFRGRLAASWDISEEAFFYVNERAIVPEIGNADPETLRDFLVRAKDGHYDDNQALADTLRNIEEITLVSAQEFTVQRKEKGKGEGDEARLVTIRVAAPARIKLKLTRVDQELFERLSILLGKEYFSTFPAADYLFIEPTEWEKKQGQYAVELLPAMEHNPVIVFHLRPGVRFHDGHPVTAEDVRFTYESIMNPANLSPRLADYEPVKKVEVLDPLFIRIVYKRLYSPALSTWAMGILPEHRLNETELKDEARRLGKDQASFTMRQSAFNREPIGCGPFVFREWKADQYIILDRFRDYWEGPPRYQRYVYRIIPDPLTQEMEFYAGTIDNYSVQPHQVERLQNDPRFQEFSGLSFGYTYIGYNMRREPFTDPRVRQALGMAIDVDKIIKYVLYGQAERITGPFVKQSEFYNPNAFQLPYDPEGALRLLSEAGYTKNVAGLLEKNGKPLQFTLITNSGNDLRKAMLTIAQDAWKQLGVDVRTDVLEWSVFIQERVNKLDFDALILAWSMGIEPDLYQIWHSSQSNPYQLNFVGFHHQEADELIVKIRQEYDTNRQRELCHRLHEIIAREQPYTFLYVTKWTAVLDRRIVIMDLNDQGLPVYSKIRPTRTGNYSFYFNKWTKLPEVPVFAGE